MHAHYEDIISRIGTPPVWFDEYAVPRYCEFAPERSASVYISEIALAEIACQHCGLVFHVAFSQVNVPFGTIAEAIRAKALRYGDPPNVQCCDAGPTTTSDPRRVLEYWHRHDQRYVENGKVVDYRAYIRWVRDYSLEVDISRRRLRQRRPKSPNKVVR